MYRKRVSNIVEKKLCVVCGSDLNCKMLGFPSWNWNSAATLSKLSELEKKQCNNWNRFVEKFKRNEWNDIMGVKKPFYQYKVPLELDSWIKLTFMSSYHMYGPGFNGLFDHDSGHSFIWKHTVEKSQTNATICESNALQCSNVIYNALHKYWHWKFCSHSFTDFVMRVTGPMMQLCKFWQLLPASIFPFSTC